MALTATQLSIEDIGAQFYPGPKQKIKPKKKINFYFKFKLSTLRKMSKPKP